MSNNLPPLPARPYRRIATEEAFSPPEMLEIYKRILAKDDVDVGFKHLMGFYMSSPSERAQHIMRCLTEWLLPRWPMTSWPLPRAVTPTASSA
jgi:2,3-dihydroxybenzoate decarboxylase